LEKRAVRAVYMMPQLLVGTHIGDVVEWIDGTGVRGAGVRDHHEWQQAVTTVLRDRLAQQVYRQAKVRVARNGSHPIGHDAGQLRRLDHAMVRLIRRIQHTAPDVGAQVLLTRAQHRVEGGHRATGREHTARAHGESRPLAQPVQRVRFQLHQRWRGLPDTGVAVRGISDEVRQRRGKQPTTGDVREISGRRRVERLRDLRREQIVE